MASTIKLGIVLLGPRSLALGPAHAATARLLKEGSPGKAAFYTKVSCPQVLRLLGYISNSTQTKEEAPLPPPPPPPPPPVAPLLLLHSSKQRKVTLDCMFASLLLMPRSLLCLAASLAVSSDSRLPG